MLRPNYQVFVVNLGQTGELGAAAVSGQQSIPALINYFRFVSAVDANGNPALGANVNVALSRTLGDPIPFGLNSLIKLPGGTEFIRVTWPLQPGIVATFLASDQDQDGVQIEAPPAKQLVFTSIGVSPLIYGDVTVGAAVAQIVAAQPTRQRLTIRAAMANSAPVWIGDAAVTSGTGMPLFANEVLELDGTTVAIFAISSAAGQHVRFIAEV